MEFIEKAKVRHDHWIPHSGHHNEEYEVLAEQLEEAGKSESAGYLREMIDLTSKSIECLKNALKALE